MNKYICFINAITNDFHKTNEFCEKKKNLYLYSKIITLKYEIGFVSNNKYNIVKYVNTDIKPRDICLSDNIKNTSIDMGDILLQFSKDIKTVNIIVCHSSNHTMNTLLSESVRCNIPISINNILIIDISNFQLEHSNMSLVDLYKNIVNNKESNDNIDMIKKIFFKLYEKSYKKSIA